MGRCKQTGDMNRIRLIGYWLGPNAAGWPDVHDFVDRSWDRSERQMVIERLHTGEPAPWMSMGKSRCRFCEVRNGYREYSDGTFLWPEGLVHYLEEHDVRLPHEVVTHFGRREGSLPFVAEVVHSLTDESIDRDWWARSTLVTSRRVNEGCSTCARCATTHVSQRGRLVYKDFTRH